MHGNKNVNFLTHYWREESLDRRTEYQIFQEYSAQLFSSGFVFVEGIAQDISWPSDHKRRVVP